VGVAWNGMVQVVGMRLNSVLASVVLEAAMGTPAFFAMELVQSRS